MKVGDLVKWESVLNDSMDYHTTEYGIVTKMFPRLDRDWETITAS